MRLKESSPYTNRFFGILATFNMTAKRIIILHSFIFLTLFFTSIIFPVLSLLFPATFLGRYIAIAAIIISPFLILTRDKDGNCRLTIWENKVREQEKPGSSYFEPCLNHYSYEWFGLKLTRKFGRYLIWTLIAFPIITGIINW